MIIEICRVGGCAAGYPSGYGGGYGGGYPYYAGYGGYPYGGGYGIVRMQVRNAAVAPLACP